MLTTKNPMNDIVRDELREVVVMMHDRGDSVEETLAQAERMCGQANCEFEGEGGGVSVVEEVYGGKWNGGQFVFKSATLTPSSSPSNVDTTPIDVAAESSAAAPSVADEQPHLTSQESQSPSHSHRSAKKSAKKK